MKLPYRSAPSFLSILSWLPSPPLPIVRRYPRRFAVPFTRLICRYLYRVIPARSDTTPPFPPSPFCSGSIPLASRDDLAFSFVRAKFPRERRHPSLRRTHHRGRCPRAMIILRSTTCLSHRVQARTPYFVNERRSSRPPDRPWNSRKEVWRALRPVGDILLSRSLRPSPRFASSRELDIHIYRSAPSGIEVPPSGDSRDFNNKMEREDIWVSLG